MLRPILVIVPSVYAAGAELQAMLQIRELLRRGVPVRLMVLSETVDLDVLAGAELPKEHLCRLRNRSAVLDKAFLRALWRDLGPAAAFARRHEIGTVIAHLPPAHFFARLLYLGLLLRRRRVRLVQYHHSLERKLNPNDTLAKRAFFIVNQLLARLADHAHWHISGQVRDDVGTGFTRRGAILPNTCDMASPGDPAAARQLLPPTGNGTRPYVVLVPGRLKSMKGHVMFLHAFARFCRAESVTAEDVRVIMAGEGDDRARIEAALRELCLGDRVQLAGETAHPTLLALYGMADLVVVPSLDEGFGIVAIEAISRGALVLSSDAGGLSDVVRHGENGLQFAAGDEDALVAQMTAAWQSRDRQLIDREAARKDCVARFGLQTHIDRMLALLES